ncbi:type II-A CRISPR-associated protein Csn2 [Furfurilactobacillus curtus]|uniref:Type II-A CRISPR-associated protein Csn2 n=1 Tax=Furfurilactobacillus curtus TaxID=1746200 RepID=A0ABQ5JSR8_9LACO
MDQLTYYPFEPIKLQAGLNFLTITNANTLWEITSHLREYDEKIVCSDAGKQLVCSKALIYFGSLNGSFDINAFFNRQAVKVLIDCLDEEELRNLYELDCQEKTLLTQVIFENNLPLKIQDTWDSKTAIKDQSIMIDLPQTLSPYDKIGAVITIMNELNDHRLLVLTDVWFFLTTDQLTELAEYAGSLGVKVLFIERQINDVETSDYIWKTTIDEDFVQF